MLPWTRLWSTRCGRHFSSIIALNSTLQRVSSVAHWSARPTRLKLCRARATLCVFWYDYVTFVASCVIGANIALFVIGHPLLIIFKSRVNLHIHQKWMADNVMRPNKDFGNVVPRHFSNGRRPNLVLTSLKRTSKGCKSEQTIGCDWVSCAILLPKRRFWKTEQKIGRVFEYKIWATIH